MRKTLILLSFALILSLSAWAAVSVPNPGGNPPTDPWFVNKDLQNLGPDAYDLAIVLAGTESISITFDGYDPDDDLPGQFRPPTIEPAGPNTRIHWETFWDGQDNRIDTNQTIHVGYGTDGSSRVVDMYWTDPHGNRIPGSVVYDVYAKTTYRSGRLILDISHEFQTNVAISVRNLRIAVLQDGVALADLNRSNVRLSEALRPIGFDFSLAPGETRSIEVPQDIPAGAAVVAVYDVYGPASSAIVTNYVESFAPAAW